MHFLEFSIVINKRYNDHCWVPIDSNQSMVFQLFTGTTTAKGDPKSIYAKQI